MTERQRRRTYHAQAHGELNHLIEKHTRTGMVPQPAHSRHDARVVHNLSVSAPALHRRGHHNKTYQYEGRILKSELRIHPLASVPSASAFTRTYRDERDSLHRDTPRPTTGARGSAGETHCRASQQASVQARQTSRCRRKKRKPAVDCSRRAGIAECGGSGNNSRRRKPKQTLSREKEKVRRAGPPSVLKV
jgi:hypothetical protein